MSKHTPGPWLIEAQNCHTGDIATVYQTSEGWVTIYAPHWAETGMEPPEQSANARLIAAAPDLLKALKECRNAIQGGQPLEPYDSRGAGYQQQFGAAFLEYLNAAIAKATGEAA